GRRGADRPVEQRARLGQPAGQQHRLRPLDQQPRDRLRQPCPLVHARRLLQYRGGLFVAEAPHHGAGGGLAALDRAAGGLRGARERGAGRRAWWAYLVSRREPATEEGGPEPAGDAAVSGGPRRSAAVAWASHRSPTVSRSWRDSRMSSWVKVKSSRSPTLTSP